MDDVYGKIDVFPQHFGVTKVSDDHLQTRSEEGDFPIRSPSRWLTVRRVMGAASLLNIFSLPDLPWASSSNEDKVVLTKGELECLRSDIADAEEREANLKAKLEHVDVILRSARLSGYLYVRTRWTQLPGEPPILDDADVDDWLPRFVVLYGACVFYYLNSTDLSPQDSTLLTDIVDVGPLPSFTQEDEQRRYSFYILTHQGLRFECSSVSKIQIDSWFTELQRDCGIEPDATMNNSAES